MQEACQTMHTGEILNVEHTVYPLYEAVFYGNHVDTAKFSKRLSCALRRLPVRVQCAYEYDTLKALDRGITKDPTLLLNGKIFIEGLAQAEEIRKRFETLLAQI